MSQPPLAPPASNPLVMRANPFTHDTGVAVVRPHQTLQAMLDEAAQGAEIALTVRVEIGGIEVPRALWARVKPKPGTAIHVTRMPAGDGDGKKWIRTILMIVVMIVAWYASPYLAAAYGGTASMWAAAIYMVGSLIVNALVPPPQPKMGGGGMGDVGRLNQLTGSQNQLAPYGPIPLVLGECRLFPPHAAMPYSESLGQTSYQRLMFDLGHDYGGPNDPVYMDVSDIRIGDTPIDQFEGVEYEITRTPTLYTSDVNEVGITAAMNDGDSVTRTTAPNVDAISLDIVFAQGLFGVDKKNRDVAVFATFRVEYRPVGSATWLRAPVSGQVGSGGGQARSYSVLLPIAGPNITHTFTVGTPSRKPFVAGYAWDVPTGQYEVRVTRTGTNWGNSEPGARMGDAQWSVMRSIRRTNPSSTGTVKLCMRIKASEQLSGPLQTLSCLVRQKVPVYEAGTWSAPVPSLNPAWVLHWLLTRCPAIAEHVPAARIDLASFADYAAFCATHDFETRGVLDTRVTARALIDDLLACALGAITTRDGKYGVLFDHGETVPVMVFTPLDSKGFQHSRVFTKLPHALRVRFKNPAADWQMDEITVVDDGYSHRGRDARGQPSTLPEPTEFETLELRFAADAHQAWRVGRHHFAQAKFRPNSYTWETDIANLGCTRGDLVHVAHDVTEWGAGWGRLRTLDGALMELDEYVELQPGLRYSARIRRADGTSFVVPVEASVPGGTRFFTALGDLPGVAPGDVVVIGETTRETAALLVTGIQAQADLGARLTAVEYDARVLPYWTSPPETIISEVTGTAYKDPPPEPIITVVLSAQGNDGTNDGGVTTPGVHLITRPGSGFRRLPHIAREAL